MIARQIENAMASYLLTESDPSLGGLYQFKLNEGFGATLPIRTGHDNAGELPENGYILVESLDAQVRQEITTLNAFTCSVAVMLCYPSDAHDEDRKPLPSFDACVEELHNAIGQNGLPQSLTLQGRGVYVAGLASGLAFETGIDGRNRTATWTVEMAASKTLNTI